MNDFLEFVLNLLDRGISLAIFAVIICAFGVIAAFVIFHLVTKGKKKFPWVRSILLLIIIGYFAVLSYATLLRYGGGGGYREMNLHLFRAWREAWNTFFFQDWLNIFINIAMFIPLGAILPLMAKLFRRWYVTVPFGFAVSLIIEMIQYFTGRGIMDVDDIFTNTLGTALGYCIIMIITTAFCKQKKCGLKCFAYSSVPLIFTVALIGIFGGYHLKEYGNLAETPYFTANTKGIEWQLQFEPDDESKIVPTYHRKPYNKKTCDEFGEQFAKNLGIVFEDKYYYNSMTVFANHFGGGFLDVYYNDGSYSYTAGGAIGQKNAEFSREEVIKMLESFDIYIPDEADFFIDEYGNHIFTVDMVFRDGRLYDGELSCKCSENSAVTKIENNLLIFDKYKDVKIISESEAYKKLKAGKFSGNDFLERYDIEEIIVKSIALDYMADTKGFYQPVYVFELQFNETCDIDAAVPAMK